MANSYYANLRICLSSFSCILMLFLGSSGISYFNFILSSAIAEEQNRDPFIVKAPKNSSAFGNFEYNPTTGVLSKKAVADSTDEQGPITDLFEISAFSALADNTTQLTPEEIELFPMLTGEDAELAGSLGQVLLVRIKNTWGIISPGLKKPLAKEIPGQKWGVGDGIFLGSSEPPKGKNTNLERVYFFTIKGNIELGTSKKDDLHKSFLKSLKEQPNERPILVFVKLDGSVSWLPLRRDISVAALSVSVPAKDKVLVAAKFNNVVEEKNSAKEKKSGKKSFTNVPFSGQLIVDLKTNYGQIEVGDQLQFIGKSSKKLMSVVAFDNNSEEGPKLVKLNSSVEPKKVEPTTNTVVENLEKLLLTRDEAATQVEAERKFGNETREMAEELLFGQKETAQETVHLAQRWLRPSTRFPVYVVAGPDSALKDELTEKLTKKMFPGVKNPLFNFSLRQTGHKEFIQTELFNVAPGFEGADAPSRLTSWLLQNPNGGVIYFQDFETSPEAMNLVSSFIESGEVELSPPLVQSLAQNKHFKSTPEYKALANAAGGEKNLSGAVKLKLSPKHVIIIGSNSGTELYTGTSKSNIKGRALTSEQEIEYANQSLTSERVKAAMRAAGVNDRVMGKIEGVITVKALTLETSEKALRKLLKEEFDFLSQKRHLTVEISEEHLLALVKDSYDALAGIDGLRTMVQNKVEGPINKALVEDQTIQVGDHLVLELERGDGIHKRSRILIRRKSNGMLLSSANIGPELPFRPTKLLERAKSKLLSTLNEMVLSHENTKKKIADLIITNYALAVEDPVLNRGGVLIYEDGPPGNGKTEKGRAIAKTFYDNPDSLVRVNFNEIHTFDDFRVRFIERIAAEARARPDGFVIHMDEFPRAAQSHPGEATKIWNEFLSILENLEVTIIERKYQNNVLVETPVKVKLPPGTFFYATGNESEKAISGNFESMSHREVTAHFSFLSRHPEKFKSVLANLFPPALLSRMGEVILSMPLSEQYYSVLRERFLKKQAKFLTDRGIKLNFDSSAIDFLRKEHVAARGARWIDSTLKEHMTGPLIAFVARNIEEFKPGGSLHESSISLGFDFKSRQTIAIITNSSGVQTQQTELSFVPRTKTEYHPVIEAFEHRKTSLHEAGHTVLTRSFYGPGSVEEVNTFGGGQGGWMESATNIATRRMYSDPMTVFKELAVLLGGHIAEQIFKVGPTEGASIDYRYARETSSMMLLDGAAFELSPKPMIKGPDGKWIIAQETVTELTKEQKAIFNISGEIARLILLKNKSLIEEIANTLDSKESASLSNPEVEAIISRHGIWRANEQTILEIAKTKKMAWLVCESVLTDQTGSSSEAPNKWQKLINTARYLLSNPKVTSWNKEGGGQ